MGAQLELLFIMMNAVWLLYLGPFVAIGSILCGGWFVAEVVTATHQVIKLFFIFLFTTNLTLFCCFLCYVFEHINIKYCSESFV